MTEELRTLRDIVIRLDGAGIEYMLTNSMALKKLHWAKESHSDRQLADVENLIATGCDAAYLREWSARLNLTDMLTRVSP